jgi:DNA polymerase
MGISTEALERRIRACTLCRLHISRKNAVPGEGPLNARIIFCGEAPGYNESVQGRPFVGRAGKFLNELLQSVGISREEVYITNVVKCRPPENRAPLDDEIQTCVPNYLAKQIQMLKPTLVVLLGRTAAKALLGEDVVMGEQHGKLRDCTVAGVKFTIFLTYHPAAALYGEEARQRLQEDFRMLAGLIRQTPELNKSKEQ